MVSQESVAFYQRRASALYHKAWGKRWPHQHTGSILRTDVVPASQPIDDDAMDLDPDDMPVPVVGDVYGGSAVDIPEQFNYICLEEMNDVANTLGSTTDMEDVLIVRDEYVKLRGAIGKIQTKKHKTIGMVVTGQPGIGKTAFLLYLLLYRLEQQLPTAVQFMSSIYFIFDEEGAKAVPIDDIDERLEKCWALADSNAVVIQPCTVFLSVPQIVIQASSPKAERWKEWLKQLRGTCVVSDLPHMLEIAAILKELKFGPSSAFSLVNKWGPSIRTIADIVREGLTAEQSFTFLATGAARTICANPSSIPVSSLPNMPISDSSSIVFIRPYRPRGFTDISSSKLCTCFIPTNYLNNIFETSRLESSNKQSLALFSAFSSHSLTRTAASWGYETAMHSRLCSGGQALSISRGGSADYNAAMRPSTHLLPGTAAGLKSAALSTSFYWIPSVINFPGVDGVLGDADGSIYVVQATIAAEHSNPVEGLKLIWRMVSQDLRDRGVWRFVVVANNQSTVDRHMVSFSEALKDVTFGRQHTRMEVWGCVLSQN